MSADHWAIVPSAAREVALGDVVAGMSHYVMGLVTEVTPSEHGVSIRYANGGGLYFYPYNGQIQSVIIDTRSNRIL